MSAAAEIACLRAEIEVLIAELREARGIHPVIKWEGHYGHRILGPGYPRVVYTCIDPEDLQHLEDDQLDP